MKKSFIDEIEELNARIEDEELRKGHLLRKRGWEYACNFPGGIWLWVKELKDGRILAVSQETAIYIEQNL